MSPGPHWRPAYVGLGSNLQMPARQVDDAFDLLAAIDGSRLVRRSSLYRSTPFGGIEQPDFVNAAAAMLTTLEPAEFLAELQARQAAAEAKERRAARKSAGASEFDAAADVEAEAGRHSRRGHLLHARVRSRGRSWGRFLQ